MAGEAQSCIGHQPWIDVSVVVTGDAEVQGICGPSQYTIIACAKYQPGDTAYIDKTVLYFGQRWVNSGVGWRRVIALHEFGHAVGLDDHPSDGCTPTEDTGLPSVMGHIWNLGDSPCGAQSKPNMFDIMAVACGTYHYSGCSINFAFVLGGGNAPDADGDAIPDEDDNCVGSVNSMQEDRDSDGAGNACDPDDDEDGYSDAREAYLGTDPLDDCRDTASHDSWPVDFNKDGRATTNDLGGYVPRWNAREGDPNWSQRYNLVSSEPQVLNIVDVGRFVPVLNHTCDTDTASQVLDVAQAVEPYGDYVAAQADGFEWITVEREGYGMWMLNQERLGSFDRAEPQGLIYKLDANGYPRLAGVFYLVPEWYDVPLPDAFAGPDDVWQLHEGFCIDAERVPMEDVTEANCDGAYWEEMGHVLFAWVRHVNPSGMFVELNPD